MFKYLCIVFSWYNYLAASPRLNVRKFKDSGLHSDYILYHSYHCRFYDSLLFRSVFNKLLLKKKAHLWLTATKAVECTPRYIVKLNINCCRESHLCSWLIWLHACIGKEICYIGRLLKMHIMLSSRLFSGIWLHIVLFFHFLNCRWFWLFLVFGNCYSNK